MHEGRAKKTESWKYYLLLKNHHHYSQNQMLFKKVLVVVYTLAYSVTVFHIFKIEKPCRHAEQPTAEKQRLWLREEVSRNKNNQGRGLKR